MWELLVGIQGQYRGFTRTGGAWGALGSCSCDTGRGFPAIQEDKSTISKTRLFKRSLCGVLGESLSIFHLVLINTVINSFSAIGQCTYAEA